MKANNGGIGCLIVFVWIILISIFPDNILLATALLLVGSAIAIALYNIIKNRNRKREEKRISLKVLEQNLKDLKQTLDERTRAIEILAKEKAEGFPWLAEAYADFVHLQHLRESEYLATKSHPAEKAAAIVRELGRKRGIVEKKFRIAQGLIRLYQELFPFLEDFHGDIDDYVLQQILSKNIETPIHDIGETGLDPVRSLLSRLSDEEYKKLSVTERNQLALDRYWSRHKNKWQLGRDYERYIGYLYEKEKYSVYYKGILEGYDDLGRDLICKKDNKSIVIQCKRWSQHKTIHEKHINQLFGTFIKYMIDHRDEIACVMFYTTTKLSERAHEFAKHLKIIIKENFPFDETYPSIKCNISRKTGEKIYHLPFDQQYDKTVIEEERNECYVKTVAEAENLGFRRAWKWKGNKSS